MSFHKIQNHWVAYVIGCLLLLIIQGCRPKPDVKTERISQAQLNTKNVVIGIVLPSSDNLILQDYLNGISMAQNQINRDGGIDGRRVDLIFKDDRGQLEHARHIVQSYINNPDVVAVIGHSKSNISIPMSEIYQRHGILMISPFSTNPELTEKNLNLIFRNIPSDVEFARDLARFAKNRKYRRIMIAYVNTKYGKGLTREFEAYGQHIGIEVVARNSFSPTDSIDFYPTLRHWKLERFDAVFIAGSDPQGTQIIKQMRQLGITAPVFASEDLDSPDFISNGGKAVEGTVIAIPFNPYSQRPQTSHFVQTFKKQYHYIPGAFAAQGYDTLLILTDAMKKAHSIIPAEVAASLHRLKYWPGVCGPITFTKNGEVINKPIAKKIVKNGYFEYMSDQ